MIPEIDWLEATARYLSQFYNENFHESLSDLTKMMEAMRAIDGPTWTSFRCHMLMKHVEEDWSTEWFLMRKVSTLAEFTDGSGNLAYGHVDNIGLPGVLDTPDPT